MNFQATTQAVRNVFREWSLVVKYDLTLLKTRLVPSLAQAIRRREWLISIPLLGSVFSFLWILTVEVSKIPDKQPFLLEMGSALGVVTLISCVTAYVAFFIHVCTYVDQHRYN